MEHLGLKFLVEWLWIEDRQSRYEDSIMPHQHLIHMLLFVLCRVSRYFEDMVNFRIFHLRTIYNFFQVWLCSCMCLSKSHSWDGMVWIFLMKSKDTWGGRSPDSWLIHDHQFLLKGKVLTYSPQLPYWDIRVSQTTFTQLGQLWRNEQIKTH